MKKNKVEKLLKSLVEIESMSGEEAAVMAFIGNLLTKERFDIRRIPVTSTTFCLLATVGKPKVILQAHVDTVRPYVPFSEDNEFILGRGACDTKGSVATMITAGIETKRKGFKDFGLLFTVEEETSFRGAIEAAKIFNEPLPYFIVGEPSSLKPITSHFGIETFTITAQGKAAHTSMPEAGVNAIDLIFDACTKLKLLKLGTGTLSTVAQISGGIAANIIPAEAQLVFSMRIAPGDITDYFEEIKKLLPSFQVVRGEFLSPVKSSLPSRLQFLGKGQTVRYCTELAFFRNGCILGPGNIQFAHSKDERVPKIELAKAVNIYQEIIHAFARM